MASPEQEEVPSPGDWPVDPQDDQPISKERIWVDGCFDFSHHGHAGALLQARRLGNELWVGIHSDEAILENKGPAVMTLAERCAAVEACRWSTRSVPHAPYVTSLAWISHYGCWYVAHGDDITSDSNGEDCYRYVKAAGRFLIFQRTPNISTTDLVGRMLLCTKSHFIKSLSKVLAGEEGHGNPTEREQVGKSMMQRIKDYATNETGLEPGPEVWTWEGTHTTSKRGRFNKLVDGVAPTGTTRLVYVDGGFDLFSSGHIEFLKQVHAAEEGKAYVIAGVHDDLVINQEKGLNYPIMNIFERGLCVLQCRYINAVVFGAPFSPTKPYLETMPMGRISAVYHGPTAFMPLNFDPYIDAREMGIFKEIGRHDFQHVNAGEVVMRIMRGREAFEERQRKKGEKSVGEEAARRRELLEQEAKEKEEQRLQNNGV